MRKNEIRQFREILQTIQRQLGWSRKNDIQCCGITMAQCHILMEMGNREKVSIVDLAGILGVDTSTLSRTIDNMYKAGLVDRLLNPADRRYVSLNLTSHGKDVFRTIEDSSNGYVAGIFENIPPDKHEQVLESLMLVASALGKSNDAVPCCAELGNKRKGAE